MSGRRSSWRQRPSFSLSLSPLPEDSIVEDFESSLSQHRESFAEFQPRGNADLMRTIDHRSDMRSVKAFLFMSARSAEPDWDDDCSDIETECDDSENWCSRDYDYLQHTPFPRDPFPTSQNDLTPGSTTCRLRADFLEEGERDYYIDDSWRCEEYPESIYQTESIGSATLNLSFEDADSTAAGSEATLCECPPRFMFFRSIMWRLLRRCPRCGERFVIAHGFPEKHARVAHMDAPASSSPSLLRKMRSCVAWNPQY